MVSIQLKQKRHLSTAGEVLKTLLRLCCITAFFYFCAWYFSEHRTHDVWKSAECAALFALSYLPRLVHLQDRLSAVLFYLFLLFAGLVGSVFAVFEKVYAYDSVMHFFCGVVCTVSIWDYFQKTHIHLPAALRFGSMLGFTLAVSAMWEMYEFCVFTIAKNTDVCMPSLLAEFGMPQALQTAQSLIRQSLSQPADIQAMVQNRFDTFCDVLCAVCGSTLCAVLLHKHHKEKHSKQLP